MILTLGNSKVEIAIEEEVKTPSTPSLLSESEKQEMLESWERAHWQMSLE